MEAGSQLCSTQTFPRPASGGRGSCGRVGGADRTVEYFVRNPSSASIFANSATGLTTSSGSRHGNGSRDGSGPGDPSRLSRIGRGFDGPGLRRTAAAFEGFALGASIVVAAPVAGPLALDGLYAAKWYVLVPAANAGMVAAYRYGPQIAQGRAFVGSLFSPAGQMPSLSGPYAASEVNGFAASQVAQAAGLWEGP